MCIQIISSKHFGKIHMVSFMLFGFMIVKLCPIAESQVAEWTIVGETARKMFRLHVVSDTSHIDVRENVAK